MRKVFLLILIALLPLGFKAAEVVPVTGYSACQELYEEIGLDSLVDYSTFEVAYNGFNKVTGRKKDILALVDFSKPSTQERLFVIDMGHRRLLFSTYVAHGKNSGGNYATSFSNAPRSHKSSLGFYLTENTYNSRRNGYSLQLAGLEKGFNDRAMERGVVMHGAAYVNEGLIPGAGRIGRSFGCPAVPADKNEEIIDTIKGGAVLFIYANDTNYQKNSRFVR